MLKSLHITNYALITELDIEFHRGFSVITGETGAGKSILLGAIGLLLGQRADARTIKGGANRCVIEAEFRLAGYQMEAFFEQHDFDFDGDSCLIRRELSANGKSRAFINDTPAQLAQLKELGNKLIDIHSQHQNLVLAEEDFQLNVVDIIAHNQSLRDAYTQAYNRYTEVGRRIKEAETLLAKGREDEEYLRFQLAQIDEAHLTPGLQAELEQEAQTLEHAEDIKQALYATNALLQGDASGRETDVVNALREAARQMGSISDMLPTAAALAERLESCRIEMKDIAAEVESQADSVVFDPARLEEVNERLSLIYSLQQKHHVQTDEELLRLADGFRQQLNAIDHGDEHLQALRQEHAALEATLREQGARLTQSRTAAAHEVEAQMQARLVPLGIPNVRFQVAIAPTEVPSASGMDQVEFLFSANKNGQLCPIGQVASGGEIARVMLALKAMLSGAVSLPTIIFDEIDTGVSGHIAESMALMMREMGQGGRQVISITHLPQIAALGTYHYRVYKEDDEQGTNSHIVQLSQQQRVEEIAHMLSGATLTEAAMQNAKALLKQ